MIQYFKRFRIAHILSAAAIAVLLAQIPTGHRSAQAATFNSISRIYAYGDSYSDSGAALKISSRAVEAGIPEATRLPAAPELDLYDSQGRWSNGPTAVEVLAKRLGVGLTNYAIGGAKSGNGNFFSWVDTFQDTGLFAQVEQFSTDAQINGERQSVDTEGLHFIFASANDFFEYLNEPGSPGTIDELAEQTVDNIVRSVSDLSALGAQQFVVVNSSDLAALPGAAEFEIVKESEQFTRSVNAQLPAALSALSNRLDNAQIALYDHAAISDRILANPDAYGLTNTATPCQPVFPAEPVCNNPNNYYFWDENHPTERVHRIIGEDMAQFVAARKPSQPVLEPETTLGTLLFICALGGFMFRKSKAGA